MPSAFRLSPTHSDVHRRRPSAARLPAFVCAVLLAGIPGSSIRADDVPPPPLQFRADGYVRIDQSPSGVVLDDLTNELRRLQAQADRGGKSLLILELAALDAKLDDVLMLVDLLVSAEYDRVHTVAWLPTDVRGPLAVAPLVCREIVMHPDAALGPVATSGDDLSAGLTERMLGLAGRRRNPRVPPVVFRAMIDPAQTLVRIDIASNDGEQETRVVAPEEVTLLRDAGVEIADVRVLKPANQEGLFSGEEAFREGFLVAATARDQSELAARYGLDSAELAAERKPAQVSRPALIRVEGEITPLLSSYLKRQIDRAVERRCDLLIIEIESPGGLLQDSLELAFQLADLREQGVRTVAYIPRDAVSGGALIALGCDEIYLHAFGKIGDAGPIMQTFDGQVHRAPEKIVSYLREVVRELAELKDRPAAVLMAMVDRDLEVFEATHRQTGRRTYLSAAEIAADPETWAEGPMVPESAKDLLLFVNGRRAHDLQIAESPVEGLATLRTRLGIAPGVELVAAERTWLDDTVFVLNTNFMTGALFFLGIVLLFVELHITSGLAGILSAVCFGVFFWSKFLGGTAGWLEVMLFMIGLACIAIELFIIPGFGVFGVAGGLLLLGSLVMAGVTMNDLDRGAAIGQSLSTAKTLGLAIVCTIGAGAVLSHFLPRIPILNAMILTPPNLGEPPRTSGVGVTPDPGGLTGQRGVATTVLRPSGKIRVNGQLLDAVSSAGFIEEGTPIEIVEVASNRMIVRRVEST